MHVDFDGNKVMWESSDYKTISHATTLFANSVIGDVYVYIYIYVWIYTHTVF